jgi:hypothetical protein
MFPALQHRPRVLTRGTRATERTVPDAHLLRPSYMYTDCTGRPLVMCLVARSLVEPVSRTDVGRIALKWRKPVPSPSATEHERDHGQDHRNMASPHVDVAAQPDVWSHVLRDSFPFRQRRHSSVRPFVAPTSSVPSAWLPAWPEQLPAETGPHGTRNVLMALSVQAEVFLSPALARMLIQYFLPPHPLGSAGTPRRP